MNQLNISEYLKSSSINKFCLPAEPCVIEGKHCLFIETHPTPATAKSDGANMLALDKLPALLPNLTSIQQTINNL